MELYKTLLTIHGKFMNPVSHTFCRARIIGPKQNAIRIFDRLQIGIPKGKAPLYFAFPIFLRIPMSQLIARVMSVSLL
jgi:hypothetical protein